MRPFLSFLLCSLLIGSSTLKPFTRERLIPKEYEYPEDSLSIARTFVFRNDSSGEQQWIDKSLRHTSNGNLVTEKRYAKGSQFDSTIYLNGKAIGLYNNIYIPGKITSGMVMEDTVVRDGTRLGRQLRKTFYHGPDYDVLIEGKEYFLKDTSITWQNHNYPCLVTRTEVIANFRLDTLTLQSLQSFHNLYFGKGIGLIKFTTEYKEEFISFGLKEIRERSISSPAD